jgi:predicted DNA-binding protein
MGRDWREVKRNYVQQPIYLLPETAELLRQLTATTRIPKAVLLREAVDDLLAKYAHLLKPQKRKA